MECKGWGEGEGGREREGKERGWGEKEGGECVYLFAVQDWLFSP